MAKAKKKSKPKAKKHHVLGHIKPEDSFTPLKEEHVVVAVEKSTWERIKEYMGW